MSAVESSLSRSAPPRILVLGVGDAGCLALAAALARVGFDGADLVIADASPARAQLVAENLKSAAPAVGRPLSGSQTVHAVPTALDSLGALAQVIADAASDARLVATLIGPDALRATLPAACPWSRQAEPALGAGVSALMLLLPTLLRQGGGRIVRCYPASVTSAAVGVWHAALVALLGETSIHLDSVRLPTLDAADVPPGRWDEIGECLAQRLAAARHSTRGVVLDAEACLGTYAVPEPTGWADTSVTTLH